MVEASTVTYSLGTRPSQFQDYVTYSYSMVPGIYGSKQTKSKGVAEDEGCLL